MAGTFILLALLCCPLVILFFSSIVYHHIHTRTHPDTQAGQQGVPDTGGERVYSEELDGLRAQRDLRIPGLPDNYTLQHRDNICGRSACISTVRMSPTTSPQFFTEREVARHCTKESCWVLLGTRVYDVTAFLRMHPGGEALILRKSGKDVSQEMEGPPHRHSENARQWMEQYYIGELDRDRDRDSDSDEAQTLRERRKTSEETAGKMSEKMTEEKVKEVDRNSQYNPLSSMDLDKDLVDWRKPLLWQVGHLREKYDEWVHQPVNRPIRLFGNSFLEASSKTPWYWVPVVWLPIVFYLSWYCYTSLAKGTTSLPLTSDVHILIHKYTFPLLFLMGMFLWSFIEYCLHRFVFHMKMPAHNYYLITLHFLLHGQHHKSPFDGSRLVFPPVVASLVVGSFYVMLSSLLPEILGISIFVGALWGYVVYDMIHYYHHHGSPKRGSYMYSLKAYHLRHHFEHQRAGFGVSSMLWDFPFSTVIPDEKF